MSSNVTSIDQARAAVLLENSRMPRLIRLDISCSERKLWGHDNVKRVLAFLSSTWLEVLLMHGVNIEEPSQFRVLSVNRRFRLTSKVSKLVKYGSSQQQRSRSTYHIKLVNIWSKKSK